MMSECQHLPIQTAYISKEQFYKICHISKATALYLIQNGLVPAIDTQRKTDRYLIARGDVERYLADREVHPEKYGYKPSSKSEPYFKIKKYSTLRAAKLRVIVTQNWRDVADMLKIHEVAELLGYRDAVVRAWKKELGLQVVTISQKMYIPKQYLIDFVVSPAFLEISPKSPEHLELLRSADYV